MPAILRYIEDQDFNAVANLYNNRKKPDELKWLYKDPYSPNINKYNAYVAVDNNTIIGVIGFVKSDYIYEDKLYNGIIPITWKIKDGYKGIAGILLFKKIFSQSEFALAIEGSEIAQNLYSVFKYKKVSECYMFYKVLRVKSYYKSLNNKSFLKKIGLISYLFPTLFISKSKKEIVLEKFNGKNIESLKNNNIFRKKITNEYVKWFLECPNLKSYAYTIKINGLYHGCCLMYIDSNKRGRIVHLSHLGSNLNLWNSVINECIIFLKKESCNFVSVLTHNDMAIKGYKKANFKHINNHVKPLFIKDENNVLPKSIDLLNWHIQYSEGDKGYRDI